MRALSRVMIPAALCATLACGGEKSAPAATPPATPPAPTTPPAPSTPPTTPPTAPPPTAAPDAIQELIFETALDKKEMKFKGDLVEGTAWRDANGDNVIVLSRVGKKDGGRAYLYASHYLVTAAGVKSLREVDDKVEDCEDADLTAEFRKGALEITDLDKDGIGEATFAYRLNCTTDYSPATLKLLLLENGDKYIIRGTTKLSEMGGNAGGEKEIDKSFSGGPKEFLAHAEERWAKY